MESWADCVHRQSSHTAHNLATGIPYNGDNIARHEGSASKSTPQHQAMKDLVKSLATLLEDRHPDLVRKLDKMTALSVPAMESVAESMAVSALGKTYLSDPEQVQCSCTQHESASAHEGL